MPFTVSKMVQLPPFRGADLVAYDREGNDISERLFAANGMMKVDADYAPKGQDIVCAAVSALLLALAERLQEKNLVRELIMRPGYVTIAMRGAERETEVIKCGLRQLERRFPQCVQVEDKGHFSR